MRRLIVTGANGSGKSHAARQLYDARHGNPLISFDALKLAGNWRQRPHPRSTGTCERASRLMLRPWKHVGRTRPELPEGNVDWPVQQYRFALRSLRNGARFHGKIAALLREARDTQVWQCRTTRQVAAAIEDWRRAGA